MSTPASNSPFAPFRRRAFFWLWLGVVVASIGAWGQTVGAQWLFVNDPNAATIVPLVQTASTLPMMLLALPAGVRPALDHGRHSELLHRGRVRTRDPDDARADASRPAVGVHLRGRDRFGHAVADLAGHHHRVGSSLPVRCRDQARHGQRQCGTGGRAGVGGPGDPPTGASLRCSG